MKKKILQTSLMACMVLLTVSCVHRSPFGEDELYVEALGLPSEVVVTLDAARAKEHLPVKENPVTERTERVNISLLPAATERYPLPIGDYRVSGALEGNFGSVEVGAAMLFTDGMEKVREEGEKYWTDGNLKAGVPEAGILAFTDGDYPGHVKRTVDERVKTLPHETALKMSEALAGFYVYSPETLLDLGFDLPLSVLLEMDHALFRLDNRDGEWLMSADVEMRSLKSAKSFTQILKNQIIGELKRAGVRPDFRALSEMIYQDGVMSIVRDRPLTEEQVLLFYDKLSKMSGGIV